MNGRAPLFERFTLGDSRTLRGWSKFDVAPVGGSRVAHGSLEYTLPLARRLLRYRRSMGSRGESERQAFRGTQPRGTRRDFSSLWLSPSGAVPSSRCSSWGRTSKRTIPVRSAQYMSMRPRPLVYAFSRRISSLRQVFRRAACVGAPKLHFITGKPLERMRNGASVTYDMQLTIFAR